MMRKLCHSLTSRIIKVAISNTDGGTREWAKVFLKDMGYDFTRNDMPATLKEFEEKIGSCVRCGVEKGKHTSARYCADGVFKAWHKSIPFDVKNSLVYVKGHIQLNVFQNSSDVERNRLIAIHITSLCLKVNPKISGASHSNTMEYIPILLADQSRRFYLKPSVNEGGVGWSVEKIEAKVETKIQRGEWMGGIGHCLSIMREVLTKNDEK
jgi:hypothetical protein